MSSISKLTSVPGALHPDLGPAALRNWAARQAARLAYLVVREFRIRHAISRLHRLDDRNLADLGIARPEIAQVVRRARREAERRRNMIPGGRPTR
ncbi:MAG: hypothetical protein IT561_02560 [Alphaproteobacteria bacterium]|nr:hypothetical protein [Alphaproteobacteria bacterium]